MRRKSFREFLEGDRGKGRPDRRAVLPRGGSNRDRISSEERAQRVQNRLQAAGLVTGDRPAFVVVDASEDFAVEEIGHRENSRSRPSGRPGRHVGRQCAEAGFVSSQSADAGERDAKPGERTWADDRGEQADVCGLALCFVEDGVDPGEETLGMASIGLEGARLQDGS